MVSMSCEVLVGDLNAQPLKLRSVSEVVIEKSVEVLSDTARIVLPGMVAGKPLNIEDKVQRGNKITIRLGYDGKLQDEFVGYVRSISPNNPLVIECEDETYLLRKPLVDKVFKKADMATILSYCLKGTGLTLDCQVSGVMYDKLVVMKATAYAVVQKLKQETGLSIYIDNGVMYCHLAFAEKRGTVVYDFERNVENSDGLQYVNEQDVRVLVKAIGKTAKGTSIEVERGEKGGEVVMMRYPNVSDKVTLERYAIQHLARRSYTGFRGSLLTWGISFVGVGYSAKLIDKLYDRRDGVYYVSSVKTEFSAKTGFKRTVGLGVKLVTTAP